MLFERFSGGPKCKDSWPTIKPFLSSKASRNSIDIILMEKDNLISDQKEVCNVLNDFNVHVAKEIGINNKSPYNTGPHPIIEAIKENSPP